MDGSEAKPVCECCGAPAVVHIRNEVAGEVIVRHFCLDCADAEANASPPRERRLNIPVALMIVGLIILLMSVFADALAFGSSRGFGWQQWSGVALAGLLTLAGAIMQIPTLLLIGLITGGVTVLADWLAFGSAPGFGWQQQLGSAVGVALIAASWAVARAMARGDTRP
jgi:hypothetical protein